jgi:hypothetical protein
LQFGLIGTHVDPDRKYLFEHLVQAVLLNVRQLGSKLEDVMLLTINTHFELTKSYPYEQDLQLERLFLYSYSWQLEIGITHSLLINVHPLRHCKQL